MKRIALLVLGVMAASTSAFAQAPADMDKALLAAPANLREGADRKSTRLNSSHIQKSRMPSSA